MSKSRNRNTGSKAASSKAPSPSQPVKTNAVRKAPKPSGGPISANSTKVASASKHDQILALLARKQGASLKEIQEVSGWQPHSVRGFLSGTVKTRLKLKLQSTKSNDDERRYTIAG